LPGASLTQPVLLPGQSYAKISSTWKATYSPTIGLANQFQASPPPPQISSSPTTDACDQVVMNELLANPVGDDTGQEWIELRDLDTKPVFLANCALMVNGSEYDFAPDNWIDEGQFPVFADFSDGQTIRTLSLKNTGLNTVSFGRLGANNKFEALQTIQYQDAPEGQSWARFDDGWRWLNAPTPGEDNASTEDVAPTDLDPTEFPAITPNDTDSQTTDVPVNSQPRVTITELLPNPAAPQTDENDEFVELYNPGIDALDLNGYKVQTGSNYSYSFTISSQTIAAGGYLVLTSRDTGLTLANSASQARLLDPNGITISQTDPYQDASEGAAWAWANDIWQWTTTPTPGTANIITIGVTGSKKSTAKKLLLEPQRPQNLRLKLPKHQKLKLLPPQLQTTIQTRPSNRYIWLYLWPLVPSRYYTVHMSIETTWQTSSTSVNSTEKLGEWLGRNLRGGEVIELVGDLGSGKTTFARGLARGFGSKDKVASPSFTISRVYKAGQREMHHFDFYRLQEAGIVADELTELLDDKNIVVVVEWAGLVHDVLPGGRLTITFKTSSENVRKIAFRAPKELAYLLKGRP